MTTYCEQYYTTDYYTTVSDFLIEIGGSEQKQYISAPVGVRVRSVGVDSSVLGQILSEILYTPIYNVNINSAFQDQISSEIITGIEVSVVINSFVQMLSLKTIRVGGTEPIDIYSIFQNQHKNNFLFSQWIGVDVHNSIQNIFTSSPDVIRTLSTIIEAVFQKQQTVEMLIGREGKIVIESVEQGQTTLECHIEFWGRCFTMSISLTDGIVAVSEAYSPINEDITVYSPINETIVPRLL